LFGCLRRDTDRELKALRARLLPEQAGDILHHAFGREGHGFEIELARFNLRQIENVVDDGQQASARTGDDLGIAPMACGEISRGQHLRHHHHAVHRRADLVAHCGKEVRLRGVGALGLFLGEAIVARAILDGLLQRFHVARDLRVAFLDVVDHAVERVAKYGRLVLPLRGRHAAREILSCANFGHGGGKVPDGADHVRDRNLRNRNATSDGEQCDEGSPRQRAIQVSPQVCDVGKHDKFANLLAGFHHRQRDRAAIAVQQVEPRKLAQVGRASAY
jgi:hypothetical protein